MHSGRANARGVSEAISSEMWEALNTTYNSLAGQVGLARRIGPHGFFRVRERAAVIAGLTDSTMSRDDAWRFLILGRSLERVDMVARLLTPRFAANDDGVEVAGSSCCVRVRPTKPSFGLIAASPSRCWLPSS